MLKPKFKIGQKVYAVLNESNSRRVHVKCDVCNSTGRVKVNGRSEDYTCPMCRGETETKHDGYKYVISCYEAKIGKVQIEEYATEYKNNYKSKVTYMLDQTGVGSGQIWSENRLFATEKEASDFCEKYIPSNCYDREAVLRNKYNNQ